MTVLYAAERSIPYALRPWRPFVQTIPRRPDGSESPLGGETFHANSHYLAHRQELRRDDRLVDVHLSLRTVENDTRHDWREMQRVKNELCGSDWEAIELYPAEDRVVDSANQYHLWCFPSGSMGAVAMRQVGRNDVGDMHGAGQWPVVPPDPEDRGPAVSGAVVLPVLTRCDYER